MAFFKVTVKALSLVCFVFLSSKYKCCLCGGTITDVGS